MDNVLFNRISNQVAGLDRPAFPMEYAVKLPYEITLSKSVKEVQGEKQKTNEEGQLLYKDNPEVDEFGQETYTETTESKRAVAFEEQTFTYVIDGKEVQVKDQVATEWEDLPPVMVPDEVSRTVSFQEAPFEFTYEEVLQAKKEALQAANLRKLVHYDEDFLPGSFSTDLASHAANMGDGILALHPNGQARTEKIALPAAASTFQLYLEAAPGVKVEVGATATSFVEFKDNIAQLPAAEDAVYIRFTNTEEKYRDVFAFGILI